MRGIFSPAARRLAKIPGMLVATEIEDYTRRPFEQTRSGPI